MPWPSGSNGDPSTSATNVDAFARWRGRRADVAVVYTERSSWNGIIGAGWLMTDFRGWPGRLVISQPPYPDGQGDLATCASGAYDQRWRTFGDTLVRHARGSSIVRIAWEGNGDFMYWAATTPQDYRDCFRHVAAAIRASDPAVSIEWTVNAHGSQRCNGNAIACYPGDDAVDIVGIDNYDQYPATLTRAAFDRVAASPDGLDYLYAFATAHKKRFAVGEWGVVTGPRGGGDNAFFVNAMFAWFAAHASGLAYEAYFNQCGPSTVVTDLFRCGPANPRAAAAYLADLPR
jgi:hypothetical protein